MAKVKKFGSKRTKRYDEGGGVEEMKKGIASNQTYSAPEYTKAEEKDLGASKTTRQRFNEAFAKNKGGGKSFEFEGKMYSTAVKGAAKPAAKSADRSSNESSAETNRLIRSAANRPAAEPGLESVHPEDYMGVTTALKAIPKLAVKAAAYTAERAAAKKAAEVATRRVEPTLNELRDITPKQIGGGSVKQLEAPPKQIGYKKPEPKPDNNRSPRNDDESRFADEGNPNFKRGGKVKKMAKGGSASSRADGCAIRGKTRA